MSPACPTSSSAKLKLTCLGPGALPSASNEKPGTVAGLFTHFLSLGASAVVSPPTTPDFTAFLTLLVSATPFVFLALGLLPCSGLLGTTAQGQRELFKHIPAAASEPKFRELSQACPRKETRTGGMSFPKNISRFPSGGASGRVEDRAMDYTGHSAPL